MGGFLQAVAGGIAAAKDPQAAQQRQQQQKDDQLKLQLGPLTQALAADRQKLTAFIDPTGNVIPEHQKDYDATVKNMTDMIARQRTLLGGRQPGDDPNHFESTIASLTDKLHITHDLAHRLKTRQQGKHDQWDQQNTQTAQDTAAGATPPEVGALSPGDQAKAVRIKAGLEPNADTTYRVDNAPEKAPKIPKGLKAMEQGGVAFGIENQDDGKQYLPSQLGPNGNAPPEAKQMWQTYQEQKKAKDAEEHRKEDERNARQAATIAAGFERMGKSQEFQENMAQYRSDLGTYRTLNTAADQSELTVKALENQYAQPGSKAVADNELQNFYTTVVQKGGRKTAAELNLTLKIGSFGMNLEQMAQKAATGELPEALRKNLLEGMKAVAQEQRAAAEQAKPELPKITAPETPRTKELRNSRGWTPPTDAPPAPKENGKLLKADGKVIAKSQGGQWVKP